MGDFIEERLNKKRKVLVVDDELVNRRMLEKIICEEYEVLLAENGREALGVILDNRDTLALVLLDLIMPDMDGYELLTLMHNDISLAGIPVIVLTSEVSAEVRSLQLGAADFIPKPYDVPEVILSRIHKTIQLFDSSNIISATQNDPLTGLFNREFFLEYASVHDQYYPDLRMDAFVFDINRFHLLNEMNGRSFGDRVLTKVADGIRTLLEERQGIACRENADVFFLYLPHTDYPEEVYTHVENGIIGMLEDARARLRMGVYPNVNKTLEMSRRFDCARLACNSVRNNFGDRIAVYDSDMHERETYAQRLIGDMEKALSEKQFKVFYQPKYDITGEEPVLSSAEALIRWEHPELGMISPENFIPLFEENGLIQRLDRFVWHEAAAQISRWKDAYGTVIPVSVNVSRIDLCEPGFVDEMLSIVKENDLRPEDYYLEVTESAYTGNSEQIIEVVNNLRSEGFRIEMDDFGTGYSSLNMLSTMPIDVIKLDMKFVRNIHVNPKDLRMVELIMDIADFLSLRVVAEGVELEEQYRLLKEHGCDVVQGFYFSRPVRPDQFCKFIEEKTGKEN